MCLNTREMQWHKFRQNIRMVIDTPVLTMSSQIATVRQRLCAFDRRPFHFVFIASCMIHAYAQQFLHAVAAWSECCTLSAVESNLQKKKCYSSDDGMEI